jgi:predicted DNA-binding ribbon-helix-helix protein
MQSSIVKRSIVIAGHKTSISLEDAFWRALKDIAWSQRLAVNNLVSRINSERKNGNLSSAIRLFALDHYQNDSGRRITAPQMIAIQPQAH